LHKEGCRLGCRLARGRDDRWEAACTRRNMGKDAGKDAGRNAWRDAGRDACRDAGLQGGLHRPPGHCSQQAGGALGCQ
ncbi:unnamed protein product, partial [Coccothraustes coccothraustes]